VIRYYNIGSDRISANLFPDSGYAIYFFVLIQKNNKKDQSRPGGMKKS